MPFVNERISAEDADSYRIAEANSRADLDRGAALYWTIDRDRNVHLRWIRARTIAPAENEFLLSWQGTLLRMVLLRIPSRLRDGTRSTRWTFLGFEDVVPPEGARTFLAYREQVLSDLKAALICYREFGVFSKAERHLAIFEF